MLFTIILLSALTACGGVSYSSIDLQFDPVMSDSPEHFTEITFHNETIGELLQYTVPQDGIFSIEAIPRASYRVTVSRFGSEEIFDLDIKSKHYSLDKRLFQDVKGGLTEGTHYIIASTEQFMNLAKMSGAKTTVYYHLSNDLDFKDKEYNPISSFNGVLDGRYYGVNSGQGFKISNINISLQDQDDVGLFRVNEGEIKNILFDKIKVTGKDNVGVVAGVNLGIISNCDIISGTITANNFAGSYTGIDRGSISLSTSTATVNCEGYFGRIAGISYSNMTLGAYGIRPSLAGVNSINGLTPLEMYLVALDNWYALDNRAVLQTAEMKVDVTDTVNTVINNIKSAMPRFSLEGIILGLIGGREFSVTEVIIARRIYEGNYDDGLQRLLVTGGGFTKATSFDPLLNTFMALPEIGDMIKDLDMQFPFGYAVYYDEKAGELIELQMTTNAYVASDNTVSYTLEDEVYYANITQDIQEFAEEDDNFDQELLDKIFFYIAEGKNNMLKLEFMDLSAEGAVVDVKDITHNNGIHKFTLVVDGHYAFKYLKDRMQQAIDDEFLGTVAEGTTINLVFHKDIEFIVEIWDNGNLRALRLNDLDATITVNLTSDTQEMIKDIVAGIDFNNDGRVGDVKNFKLESVSVSVSGNIRDQYSYSRTDTDIDIYLEEFDKPKIRILDQINEETQDEIE